MRAFDLFMWGSCSSNSTAVAAVSADRAVAQRFVRVEVSRIGFDVF